MAVSKPLESSKLYHCSIYYNYFEGHQSRRDKDHKLSYEFVRHLKTKLFEIGRTKVRYFDDLPPGVNLFEELFSNMMVNAEKIVVIFTKGFNENHWHKLTHQSTFKELLDKKESNNLLGISMGLNKNELSKELGVCVQNLVYFDDDWKNDDENWSLITRFFLEERPIYELPQRLLSQTPVQESSGDIIETDGENVSNEVDGAGEANSQSVDSGKRATNSPETVPLTLSIRPQLKETPPIADDIDLRHDAPSISVSSDSRENTNSTEKEDHKQTTAGFFYMVWSLLDWMTKNVSL